jgi:hypothetical protein
MFYIQRVECFHPQASVNKTPQEGKGMITKRRLIIANVAALLGASLASQAHAEMCANKKTGQMFSRATCKLNETVVPIPSAIDKSPCTIDSIAGVFSSYTNDDYSNSLESCILVLNKDGAVSNASSCVGARNGVNIPVVKVINGQITMLGAASQCIYRITYTKENGRSFMMTGSLNGIRENYNGFGEDFDGVMKGTMVSTRYYPVNSSSASAQTSNSGSGDKHNDVLNQIAKEYLRID